MTNFVNEDDKLLWDVNNETDFLQKHKHHIFSILQHSSL